MSQFEKILLAILSGTRDSNIQFADLQTVLIKLGFQCRVRGDHFIYTRDGIAEIINLQPTSNRKAQPYQVKQVRNILFRSQLGAAIYHQV